MPRLTEPITLSVSPENSAAFAKVGKGNFEGNCTERKLSMRILMEEVKPIIREEPELEGWDISQLLSFF